jgi:hypothetical protein
VYVDLHHVDSRDSDYGKLPAHTNIALLLEDGIARARSTHVADGLRHKFFARLDDDTIPHRLNESRCVHHSKFGFLPAACSRESSMD